jgi:ATP-dependent Clp protease ATP-binding subunit ClpB
LTEAVRSKPYSLILLDEIEKANIKVLDLFLQVLDEGNLTDGLGRKVNFSNTIIIMTSNACSYQIAEMVGAGKKYIDVYRTVVMELRKVFRVEFLNRFDKVIMFKPLLPLDLLQVVDLMLKKVKESLEAQGIEIAYSKELLKQIVENGYDPVYGAREIRREIQDSVEDKIAQLIIDKQAHSGSLITINNLEDFVVT